MLGRCIAFLPPVTRTDAGQPRSSGPRGAPEGGPSRRLPRRARPWPAARPAAPAHRSRTDRRPAGGTARSARWAAASPSKVVALVLPHTAHDVACRRPERGSARRIRERAVRRRRRRTPFRRSRTSWCPGEPGAVVPYAELRTTQFTGPQYGTQQSLNSPSTVPRTTQQPSATHRGPSPRLW